MMPMRLLSSDMVEARNMTQIVVDPALRSRLGDLTQALELCDERGRVLAWLTPAPDPAAYEAIEPQLSAEELQRRRSEPHYSTAEVLAHLEKL